MPSLSLPEYAFIIEQVAENWQLQPALKALCLTQRAFVPLCQKHIFSTLSVRSSSRKLDAFPSTVEKSPHLFNYIRNFYYELDEKDATPASVKAPRTENTVLLLERLRNLHLLSVIGPKAHEVRWGGIDIRISNTLLRLMHSPDLRSLHLEGLSHFPAHAIVGLRNSANLKTLSFSALEVESAPESKSDPGPGPAVLAELSKFSAYARCSDAVSTFVVGTLNFGKDSVVGVGLPRLKEIYMEWENARDMKVGHLLIGSTPQLQELFCELPKSSEANFQGLAVPILRGPARTLRSLKFYTSEPAEDDDEPFLGIIPELKKLSGGKMQKLEDITINFTLFTSDADSGPRSLIPAINAGCRSLDGIFADRDAFPALRRISIYFLVCVAHDPSYGHFVLERQFNAVSRRIKQQSFKNLDGISTIDLSFTLEMEWTEE